MPPRKNDDYMQVDSGDDSFPSDVDEMYNGKSKGKGKAKATERKTRDKGKSKNNEVRHKVNWFINWTLNRLRSATVRLGGLVCALLGHGAGGRRRQLARRCGRAHCSKSQTKVCHPFDIFYLRVLRRIQPRLLAPSTAIRRTIIRHLVLVLDLSSSMVDRDMRPTRFDLTLEYARSFISEWFDQNPLGQIGIVGMRSGIAERIGEMSGELYLPRVGRTSTRASKAIHRMYLKQYRNATNWSPPEILVYKTPSKWPEVA